MARTRRRYSGSVRLWLLVLLIPGIVGLLLFDSAGDYRAVRAMTERVFDGALLEPAKVLETSVEFSPDGSLGINAPFYAHAMLESRAGERKYFQVEEISPLVENLAGAAAEGISGSLLLGMQGLPRPPRLAERESVPVFYDATHRGDRVRMLALWRDLHHDGIHKQVLVLVGESMGARLSTQNATWRAGLVRDGWILLLAVLLVLFSVHWALRPLGRLQRDVGRRRMDDLTPLDTVRIPHEVAPLVQAVNHHIALYREVLDEQARFLADASHQLRTPLAIMRTQAQYARREPDIGRIRESLDAIVGQLEQTTRLTEQLLSLAHASHGGNRVRAPVELRALTRELVLQYLPLARERGQDLGWCDVAVSTEHEGADIWVLADGGELHEAIGNLLHNAIKHAGPGRRITVSVGQDAAQAWASVRDDGPGLASALRGSAFARFDRGGRGREGVRGSGGSGLGLAIALAYAQRNGGTIELSDGDPNHEGGVGLRATLKMPAYRGRLSATRGA